MDKVIKSRIHEHLPHRVIERLWAICNKKTVLDNNTKADMLIDMLHEENIEFSELGPGTNRLAVLIDNYVFKLAMDKWGVYDNLNEFTMSMELQPFVVKTYETNGVISVCEYVTLISRDEFIEEKETLRSILATLAESYLLGDVGIVEKNFTNWGYRDNNEVVILDYAYIYRVDGMDLHCTSERCENKQHFLEYNTSFSSLYCPHCGAKYQFIDIRRRITQDQEYFEHQEGLDAAYRLTKPREVFKEEQKSEPEVYYQHDAYTGEVEDSNSPLNTNAYSKEETTMRDNYENPYQDEEDEFAELRNATQELLERKRLEEAGHPAELILAGDVDGDIIPATEDDKVNMVHIHREDETSTQDIRIITTEKSVDVQKSVAEALEATTDGIVDVVDGVAKVEASTEKLLADQAEHERLAEAYEEEVESEDEAPESEEEPVEVEEVEASEEQSEDVSVETGDDEPEDADVEVLDKDHVVEADKAVVQTNAQQTTVGFNESDLIKIDSTVVIDTEAHVVHSVSHVDVLSADEKRSQQHIAELRGFVTEEDDDDDDELDAEQAERLRKMEEADKVAQKFPEYDDGDEDEDQRRRGGNRAWK